jgi:hypothetical protein
MATVEEVIRDNRDRVRQIMPSRRGVIKSVLDRVADVALETAAKMSLDRVINTIEFWNEDRLSQSATTFIRKELRHIEAHVRGTKRKQDDITWREILNRHEGASGRSLGRRYVAALAMRLLNGTLASRLQEYAIKNPEDGAVLLDVIADALKNLDIDVSDLRLNQAEEFVNVTKKSITKQEITMTEINELGLDPNRPNVQALTTADVFMTAMMMGSQRSAESLLLLVNNPKYTIAAYRDWLAANGFT